MTPSFPSKSIQAKFHPFISRRCSVQLNRRTLPKHNRVKVSRCLKNMKNQPQYHSLAALVVGLFFTDYKSKTAATNWHHNSFTPGTVAASCCRSWFHPSASTTSTATWRCAPDRNGHASESESLRSDAHCECE